MPDQNDLPPGTFGMAVSRIWRDTGFRGVLQHPVVAAALLRLACAQAGIADLDPRTLRRESERQIGPELAQAENDVIWSSPDAWPGAACTYFHIEVQSTVEQNMALRMLRYVALHSFRLWSDHGPPMPVVVPIVFYTGEEPWDASLETGALYAAAPPGYCPLLHCEVVDLCRLEVPEGSENLIELLAPVWRGESATEVVRGARALYKQLAALGDKPMEESFLDLVLARCERKWPEENWKDCASMAELVKAMEQTWPQKWRARYVAEGRTRGIKEGRTRGIKEGRTRGIKEGHTRGIKEGRTQGIEEGLTQARAETLASLEKAVGARFGEAAAQSFGRQLEVARQAGAAQDREIIDAISQCVVLSKSTEQLLSKLRSILPETA